MWRELNRLWARVCIVLEVGFTIGFKKSIGDTKEDIDSEEEAEI